MNHKLLSQAALRLALGPLRGGGAEPAIGAYHWPNGTADVDAFDAWLDRPTVRGLNFVGNESWDNLEWPTWWLEHWSKCKHERPGRRLIRSIPLLLGSIGGNHQLSPGTKQPDAASAGKK